MANESAAGSIDEYIAGLPAQTQSALEEMRALIHESAPEAVETISYAMPTFDLNGKLLVSFAGWRKHIGLYPLPKGDAALQAELAPYKSGKSTAQFPLSKPLPADLISRIIEFRVAEETGNPFVPSR